MKIVYFRNKHKIPMYRNTRENNWKITEPLRSIKSNVLLIMRLQGRNKGGGGWGLEWCLLPSSFQGGKRILKKKEKKIKNRWNERHDSLLNNWKKFVRPHPPFFRPPLHYYSCFTVALRMLVLHISISTCRFNKSPLVREDGKSIL